MLYTKLRIQSCIHPPSLCANPAAARQIAPAVSFILFATKIPQSVCGYQHESRLDFYFSCLQTWITNESPAVPQHGCELHTKQWITGFCMPLPKMTVNPFYPELEDLGVHILLSCRCNGQVCVLFWQWLIFYCILLGVLNSHRISFSLLHTLP